MGMKHFFALLISIITALLPGLAAAQAACVKQSPEHSVALLELYTSEGCDSCPPADAWLRSIGSANAPNSLIPLALHVNYWDYIGWKDRFADARFSERQNAITKLANGKVVYTPGIFLNLREFRDWSSEPKLREAVAAINARPARAAIRIALTPQADGRLGVNATFQVKPGAKAVLPQAYVAVYESALTSDVKAGENRGVTLHHDYVVRQWLGPVEFSAGTAGLSRTIALDPQWHRANHGVAAFVQEAGSPDVLQATALKVCG